MYYACKRKISTSWSDNLNVCGSLEKNSVMWHDTIKVDVKDFFECCGLT